jgi:hypothetical protein
MIADEDLEELRIDDSDNDDPQPVSKRSPRIKIGNPNQLKVNIGCIDSISERTESSGEKSDCGNSTTANLPSALDDSSPVQMKSNQDATAHTVNPFISNLII